MASKSSRTGALLMLGAAASALPLLAVDLPGHFHVLALLVVAWSLLWAVIFERRHRRQ